MVAALLTATNASACTAGGERSEAGPTRTEEPEMTRQSGRGSHGDGIANLPYARGRVFHSLDEYLAHLEANGAIDLPYWRQIRPGVYEWVVRMPGAGERETATREELMRRYGFER